MLAHLLKPIRTLLPEVDPLIKQASVEQELPTDSRDSCIASALAITYASNITGTTFDVDAMDKVANAVTLYDLEETLLPLKQDLIKRARLQRAEASRDSASDYLAKEAYFLGDLTASNDPLSRHEVAQSLTKQASDCGATPCAEVQRYAVDMAFDISAAQESLGARYQATGDTSFLKIASALSDYKGPLPSHTARDVCVTVSQMDKQAGLHYKGFDFFREALITKQAASSALQIQLAGQKFSYETLVKLGKDRITQYIGSDVAAALDEDPYSAKSSLEALPIDLQKLLANLCKHV